MNKKYSSDSKISYGKSDQDSYLESLPWKYLKTNTFQSSMKTKPKNPHEGAQIKAEKCVKKSFYEYKTAHLIIFAGILTILYFWFQIQIRLGPDESCWQQFKSNQCNYSSSQSSKCLSLLDCLKGKQIEFDFVSATITGVMVFLIAKGRKFLMKYGKQLVNVCQKMIEQKILSHK